MCQEVYEARTCHAECFVVLTLYLDRAYILIAQYEAVKSAGKCSLICRQQAGPNAAVAIIPLV